MSNKTDQEKAAKALDLIDQLNEVIDTIASYDIKIIIEDRIGNFSTREETEKTLNDI